MITLLGAHRVGPAGKVITFEPNPDAANRIEAGLRLLDDPIVFDAFRLANRAMGMAARQRRAQERGVAPADVPPPRWRPFQ